MLEVVPTHNPTPDRQRGSRVGPTTTRPQPRRAGIMEGWQPSCHQDARARLAEPIPGLGADQLSARHGRLPAPAAAAPPGSRRRRSARWSWDADQPQTRLPSGVRARRLARHPGRGDDGGAARYTDQEVGRYLGGGRALKVTVRVTVIDRASHVVLGTASFTGADPPLVTAGSTSDDVRAPPGRRHHRFPEAAPQRLIRCRESQPDARKDVRTNHTIDRKSMIRSLTPFLPDTFFCPTVGGRLRSNPPDRAWPARTAPRPISKERPGFRADV
jgi:hypothetical protein